MSRLCRIVLIIRDVEKGLRFYRDGLGLQVTAQTPTFARLRASPTSTLDLNVNQRYASLPVISPFLHFLPLASPSNRTLMHSWRCQ